MARMTARTAAVPPATRRAYSYVRFSSEPQSKGDSLRRQTAAAEAYAKQHGLELDTELNLRDLGVSAYRGGNADSGALRTFLEAAQSGIVPPGSFLLVESFDRLSREAAYDAQLTLQNLINAGVTVVTLMDGKQYNLETLRADPLALIYAILLMSRAHEESRTKGDRVGKAWARKRRDARSGHVLTRHAPAWIHVPVKADGTRGKPELIPERAAIVRRIFDMYLRGAGKTVICKTLNGEGVPTFGYSNRKTAGHWRESYIYKTLRNRAVLGELQPMREEYDPVTRRVSRVPDGEPIKNYYPRVIDETTWASAQLLLEGKQDGARPMSRVTQNLLAQLAVCPACGARMTRISKGSGPKSGIPKLVCTSAKLGQGKCRYVPVSIDAVHAAIVSARDTIASAAPGTDSRLPGLLADARAKLADKDGALNRLVDAIALELNPPAAILERIKTAQAERDALAADVERLEKQVAQTSQSLVAQRIEKLRTALAWFEVDKADIAHANAVMRECFESVTVDYLTGKLVMHWRHGPPPVVLDVPTIVTAPVQRSRPRGCAGALAPPSPRDPKGVRTRRPG